MDEKSFKLPTLDVDDVEKEIRKYENAKNSDLKAGKARKKKESKEKNNNKFDDFERYFAPSTERDQKEKITAVRCQEVADPSSLQLKDSEIYMETPTEYHPHFGFEVQGLFKSGLLFNKEYGKMKTEIQLKKASKNEEIPMKNVQEGGSFGKLLHDAQGKFQKNLGTSGRKELDGSDGITKQEDGIVRGEVYPDAYFYQISSDSPGPSGSKRDI